MWGSVAPIESDRLSCSERVMLTLIWGSPSLHHLHKWPELSVKPCHIAHIQRFTSRWSLDSSKLSDGFLIFTQAGHVSLPVWECHFWGWIGLGVRGYLAQVPDLDNNGKVDFPGELPPNFSELPRYPWARDQTLKMLRAPVKRQLAACCGMPGQMRASLSKGN